LTLQLSIPQCTYEDRRVPKVLCACNKSVAFWCC